MRVRGKGKGKGGDEGKGKGENCCGNSNLDFHPKFQPHIAVTLLGILNCNRNAKASQTLKLEQPWTSLSF